MAAKWPHLQRIQADLSNLLDIDVGLLIGYNCPAAMAPLESIVAESNEPYAIRTPLGWTLVGNVGKLNLQTATEEHISYRMLHESELIIEQEPYQHSKQGKMLEENSLDIMSQDDLKFLDIMQRGIDQDENQFITMPLPLKNNPNLPNNYSMALKRFQLLERKFKASASYAHQYQAFMNEMVEHGHAEKCTDEMKTDTEWYLPHFGVYHPHKPDRLRVVFDASAKFKNKSLNEFLLQGPDMMNDLTGVLMRFRENRIAITCDIERMFHQFRVNKENRNLIKFIWYEDQDMTKTTDFRMCVHLFGATSSPAAATYGLRHLAKLHQETHPDGAKFIQQSFYVDDGLISVETPEEADKVIREARLICSAGNIRLHKFICSDREVLKSIPSSERSASAQNIDLTMDKLPQERTLGLTWNVDSDAFTYRLNLKYNKPSTKRQVLATIAQIYDPLGFVAPFVLKGKHILRNLVSQDISWDDKVPESLFPSWEQWLQQIKTLGSIEIPRPITPKLFKRYVTEIHHFSDASFSGYGACSYSRAINQSGDVHVAFLFGKSKVVPKTVRTIPRLELTAAVLAAKIANMIEKEMQIPEASHYFWTDSKITLGYIKNTSKKFHIFVANRVHEIRERTDPNRWFFVPSDLNPADHASRGTTVEELMNNRKANWLSGPSFLLQTDLKLQRENHTSDIGDDDPEVKCYATCSAQTEETNPLLERFSKFSKWSSARNALAKLLSLAKHNQYKSQQELRRIAEIRLVLWTQQKYHKDIDKLRLIKDEDNLLRIDGRLKHGSLSLEEKHPTVLPTDSHITKLLVEHYHRECGHGGRGMTMNTVRQKGYWIIGLRKVASKIIGTCIHCKKL
jgi:hypothetical protein